MKINEISKKFQSNLIEKSSSPNLKIPLRFRNASLTTNSMYGEISNKIYSGIKEKFERFLHSIKLYRCENVLLR